MKKVYTVPAIKVKKYNSVTEINSNITLLSSGQTKMIYEDVPAVKGYTLNN